MMRRIRGRPRQSGGFTLIELVVALAVLGFALLLVTGYRPLWSSRLALEATADEVASGLRQARSEAIADNRPVQFMVDAMGHRYRVGSALPRALPAHLSVSLLTITAARRSIREGGIQFNPDGSSTGGRIMLADGRRRVAVGVDWLTGRVSVANVR
jgi:general secretion pathway protein H